LIIAEIQELIGIKVFESFAFFFLFVVIVLFSWLLFFFTLEAFVESGQT